MCEVVPGVRLSKDRTVDWSLLSVTIESMGCLGWGAG